MQKAPEIGQSPDKLNDAGGARRTPRAARKEKLTDATIAKMTYAYAAGSNEKDFRWDHGQSNFGVRVYPSGKKSFVIGYRHKGQKRFMVLCSCDEETYARAKKIAQGKLSEVANHNKDPLAEKKKNQHGEKIESLCQEYMERYAKVQKKSWKDDENRITRYIVPKWGSRRIDSITHSDVAKLHHEIGLGKSGAPYQANRLVETLAKMFDLAQKWGFLDENARNPARGIEYFREIKRDRWVTHEELPRLAEAIAGEANQYARAALWLYLLTGMRRSELLKAKWEDIDRSREELRLPETKTGRIHYVPLSKPAVALLESLPRQSGNPYIFPGLKQGAHLVNIDKPWRRVRKAAGVGDVRLHDLRRTVGSWLAQDGNTLHLIGRVLNHSSQSTTAIYARFAQDNVRLALERHTDKILEHAGAAAPVVVPRRQTRKSNKR